MWNCSGLRILENGLDNSHFAFVHRKTFGLAEMPEPAPRATRTPRRVSTCTATCS
nr:hypothetical protein [Burkholderia glumae]